MNAIQELPGGTLFVVGTPIGNVADLSSRAGEVLSQVDVIAAEDTRHTRALLTRIGAKTRLIAYHDHNEADVAASLVERLLAGERIALVTDAGMPCISDPGMLLVAEARRRGVSVVTVPGPCAATAALSISGLPSDRYCFEGFLPRRAGQRRNRLRELLAESRTLVFYESVHRIKESLTALAEVLGTQRRVVIARELTKLHESTYAGSLGELLTGFDTDIEARGEFVIVVAGAAAHSADDDAVARTYAILIRELDPKLAVSLTARLTGRARNDVYRLARG